LDLKPYFDLDLDLATKGLGLGYELDPLPGFKGPLRGGEGRRKGEKGREGKGREREERDREVGSGRGEEGKLTLMHSWNRAADWLRPALNGSALTHV